MKRSFLCSVMIAAAVVASCGGKVIVDGLGPNDPEGTGGAGGATTTTGSKNSSTGGPSSSIVVGSTGSTGPGQTSAGSGLPCDKNHTCAEAITPPAGSPQLLCPGTLSYDLYQSLLKCMCGGPCAVSCSSSACIGKPFDGSCIMCLQEPVKGCGKEFQACANDL